MTDRTKLADRITNVLGGVVALVYASSALLASALVVRLAGEAGTGLGHAAMAIAAFVFACAGSWITAPYLGRAVPRVLGVEEDER